MADKYTSSALSRKLNGLHKRLASKFKVDGEEVAIAQSLEDFLNFVVYGKGLPKNFNSLEGLLTMELAEQLKTDPRLTALFKTTYKKGLSGEQAFAYAIKRIVESKAPSILEKISDDLHEVVIGGKTATIVSQKVQNELERELITKGEKANTRLYTQFDARAGKIDVDMTQVNFSAELTGYAQRLMQITASVKNYSDIVVHLENLNREKALQSIMSETYPSMSPASLEGYAQALSNNINFEEHILHLSYVYSLTGYGQVYIDKVEESIERKFAKYLMYNNNKEQFISIKSTKEILSKLIFRSSAVQGFAARKRTSHEGYEISLNIKSLF